jgi:hypothetical protein
MVSSMKEYEAKKIISDRRKGHFTSMYVCRCCVYTNPHIDIYIARCENALSFQFQDL